MYQDKYSMWNVFVVTQAPEIPNDEYTTEFSKHWCCEFFTDMENIYDNALSKRSEKSIFINTACKMVVESYALATTENPLAQPLSNTHKKWINK